MTGLPQLRRVVVVGGSIAAVTAAESLRLEGFEGEITLLGEELTAPYSRVPLSKGVLSGKEAPDSTLLPDLGSDVTVRLGSRVSRLDTERRRLVLAEGDEVPYDGLVIATGARARRLGSAGQSGERVLRTLDDATDLAQQITGAASVLVVGAGFLGMEIASTCADLGLRVTVVDRDPPLRRLLGGWLAQLVVETARERGVRFIQTSDAVRPIGQPEITGIAYGDSRLGADLVVSAVGDVPETGWLAGSGLPLAGGLLVDRRCRVGARIVAAGDVTVTRGPDGQHRRSPHWTSAVLQGRTAAATLVRGDAAPVLPPDPYFWTHEFGLDIKISGQIPVDLPVTVLDGDPRQGSALLQWRRDDRPVASASVNYRLPVVKLKKLGARAGAAHETFADAAPPG